jgi:hypothetical protein
MQWKTRINQLLYFFKSGQSVAMCIEVQDKVVFTAPDLSTQKADRRAQLFFRFTNPSEIHDEILQNQRDQSRGIGRDCLVGACTNDSS